MAIKDLSFVNTHLFLCNGGTCKSRGAEDSTRIIRESISNLGLDLSVHTTKTLCNGRCKDGPIVIAQPQDLWFREINPGIAGEFINNFLVNNSTSADQVLFSYTDRKLNTTI